MANDRKSNISSFTASCVKNPFAKLKLPPRNVHTTQGSGEGASNGGPYDLNNMKDDGESNVSKIIKLIPGLCQIKKRPHECSRRDVNSERNVHFKHDLDNEGILIDVSPPSKKLITGKNSSRKSGCKGSRQKKKGEVNPKVMMIAMNHKRWNIGSSLNVKVTGPMNHVISEMMESNIKKVVTLSGAGMSTSAGIPDFRSPNTGIYDKLKEYNLPYAQAIFERKYFDKNPKPLFGLLKEMLAEDYKPTVAHYFVKLLEEKGLLLRHITQNVDGLERLAGLPQNKVVEAHGSVYGSRCIKCKTEYDLQWLRDRLVIQGKEIPQCQDPHCLGMVKPNIVLFGETLNPRFMSSVKNDMPECDLLIIFGTSLVVEPFASTVKKVSRKCPRIIVNNVPVGEHLGIVYAGSNDYNANRKKIRDVFIQGSCDEGALHLAKLFKWESDLEALIRRCEPETLQPRPTTACNKNDNSTNERLLYTPKMIDETKQPKFHQTQSHGKRHAHSANSDHQIQRNSTNRTAIADEKLPTTSVVSRAKNMWKRLTTSVLRLD